MQKYSRKYVIYIFIVVTILLVQFFLALSFYASNQFEEQFFKEGKFKKNHQLGLERLSPESQLYPNEAFKSNRKKSESSDQTLLPQSDSYSSNNKPNNIKSNHKLQLESLDFKPNCTIVIKDAIYAINRAKSGECKKELAHIACLIQSDELFPSYLPQYCPFEDVKKKEPITNYSNSADRSVRIAFLLTLNGRSIRQIHRLIKSLYSTRHIYFIHIDKRQEYLFNENLELENLPNIYLNRNRFSTIWGGASLLEMLINSFAELLNHKDWDYLINLSESDFPIKSLQKLENFLTANQGYNFVKSHGQDTQRFLVKQGLDKTFHQCDDHMWRLGDRQIPKGIKVDGGSDWVALTRDFCKYIVENDNDLLKGLKLFFKYTLLPVETFFHTVLRNSEFCDTIIDNNLHVTNWKRSQGCKCQYRHIVDWCGCSPNDFKIDDWPRIVDNLEKPIFFARKFEPVIDQAIINRVEMLISKTRGKVSHLGYNKYWQNEFHIKYDRNDDGKFNFYYALALLARMHIQRLCPIQTQVTIDKHLTDIEPQQGTLYFENDSYRGSLLAFYDFSAQKEQSIFFEAYGFPISHSTVYRNINQEIKLISAKVCNEYDMKEQIFRNFGCILNPFSEVGVNHRWQSDGQTNFSVSFVWIDPVETVAGSFEIAIEWPQQSRSNKQTLILYHKPNFNHPLRPGIWKLSILYKWNPVADIRFLVLPFIFRNGLPLSLSQAQYLHNGPVHKKYLEHNFTAVEKLLKLRNNPSSLEYQATVNAQKTGYELMKWSLELISQFWFIQDVCSINKSLTCLGTEINLCQETQWSSFYPDLKSKLI